MISTKQVLVVMNDEAATTETFRNFGWKLAERSETPKNDRGTLADDWTYVDPTTGALLDRRLGSGFIILKFERDDQDSLADQRLEKLFTDYCEKRDAINQEGKKKVEVDHRDVGIGGFKAGTIIGPIMMGIGIFMTAIGFDENNGSPALGSAGVVFLIVGFVVLLVFLLVGLSYRGRQVDERKHDSQICQEKLNALALGLKEITEKVRSIVQPVPETAPTQVVAPTPAVAPITAPIARPVAQPQPAIVPAQQPQPKSNDDKFTEIREYKKLLDEGIITQEEFDAKKKELL